MLTRPTKSSSIEAAIFIFLRIYEAVVSNRSLKIGCSNIYNQLSLNFSSILRQFWINDFNSEFTPISDGNVNGDVRIYVNKPAEVL